ncbi:MAG: hypothetical protein L3J71_07910 [Victivallaceae bacterium]|nr:hypothetical protein [Victivallaceae bacterium]
MKADAKLAAEKVATVRCVDVENIESASLVSRELSEGKSEKKKEKLGLLNRLFGK